MPKMKTKSGIKKRFKIRSGTLIAKKSCRRHNLRKLSPKLSRQGRGWFEVNPVDRHLIMKHAKGMK